MTDKQGLLGDLRIEEDGDLPQDVKVLLYESVRELLFNVVKHAHTRSATVGSYAPARMPLSRRWALGYNRDRKCRSGTGRGQCCRGERVATGRRTLPACRQSWFSLSAS